MPSPRGEVFRSVDAKNKLLSQLFVNDVEYFKAKPKGNGKSNLMNCAESMLTKR